MVLVSLYRAGRNGWFDRFGTFEFANRSIPLVILGLIGLILAATLVGAWLWEIRADEKEAAAHPPIPDEVDPYAGGHPVPPLPGQRLVEPSLAAPALTADSETKEAVRG